MAQRAGVSFAVDRLEVEDDRLVVSGFWTGVRGLRFMRPTLVSDDRRILATLEHKPWAHSADAAWTAAFPWNGEEVDADRLTLAVSPQVTVSLGDGGALAAVLAAGAPPTLKVVTQPPAVDTDRRDAEPAPPPAELADLVRECDDLRRRLADTERVAAERERHTLRDAATAQDEAARECAATARDRDRARQQLDEAIEAREAAVRTRARMQVAHDEALAARELAEAELAKAKAEREEANAQRDEVLLAYRALRLQLRGEHAEQDRAANDDPEAEPGSDEPIGVRTLPAARTVMSQLQHPRREQKLVLSQFDLWIIRVLGTVAAGCFILLLFSILRVFL